MVKAMSPADSPDARYRRLQKHLDGMPVGFPRTRSGVEIRLLKRLFAPDHADVALGMHWRPRTPDEIRAALPPEIAGDVADRLEEHLSRMTSGGSVLFREAEGTYALMPFVVGMYEMQLSRLDRELVEDTGGFMRQGFGFEYLTTGVRQTRIVPVEESVRPERRVATYDELSALIEGAGDRIAVVDCVCRKAADMMDHSCEVTDRRELCMAFRDYADQCIREGEGRRISKEEALEIARLNQEEGLILQPANEQHPQFLCACCGDCCGLLAIAKAVPRPADFVASNWRIDVDREACINCGACVKRCQMDALSLADRQLALDEGRCIGCGACVSACPKDALGLVERDRHLTPPEHTEELFAELERTRRPLWRKLLIGARALLGWKNRL